MAKTPNSPIRIYLDTSDYSRFADIGRRKEPEIPAVLDFLRQKKSQGLIEVRFSAIHLFEFLKDPSQRALALRKVQVIEELCGDLAFRYIGDVFDREREALRSGLESRPLIVSEDGEWFPETIVESSFDLDAVVRGLLEKFPSFNREQLEALIPQAAGYLKENMSRQLPLANVYGSDLFDRFLSGKISAPEMSREMVKGFAKPSIFITHYLEGNADAQKLFGNLATVERKFCRDLNLSRDKLKEHVKLLLGLGKDTLKAARQHVRTLSLSLSAPYLGVGSLPANLQEALGQDRFLAELPALSTHLNLLTIYIRDIVYPSAAMPEIKESDAADILHATYLPYVDLYRTDGRFGGLMAKLPRPKGVKVVSNLLQLPEAIEKELANRTS
jgi:hypothetical protein